MSASAPTTGVSNLPPMEDRREPNPSTATHGAWLRAAIELESCAHEMLDRAAELRQRANRAIAELAEHGVPQRRRDDGAEEP